MKSETNALTGKQFSQGVCFRRKVPLRFFNLQKLLHNHRAGNWFVIQDAEGKSGKPIRALL